MRTDLLTVRLEQAMRLAARAHRGQLRRGSDTPYLEHAAAVAMILDRVGYSEEVVVAGMLHDVVEDTTTTLEDLNVLFGASITGLIRHCTEVKTDERGEKRPWIDRKRDHIAAMEDAPPEARGIVLADKLHNLICIELDLSEGRPVWSQFHAERERVVWYYRAMIEVCERGDSRLEWLAAECRKVLERVVGFGSRNGGSGSLDQVASVG